MNQILRRYVIPLDNTLTVTCKEMRRVNIYVVILQSDNGAIQPFRSDIYAVVMTEGFTPLASLHGREIDKEAIVLLDSLAFVITYDRELS